MKKLAALLLTLSMLLALTACGSSSKPSASAGSGSGDGEYEPFTIMFAHDSGPDTPTAKMAEKFKADVEERSGGKITVDLYPSGQLSGNNAATTAAMLSSGDINMACLNNINDELWEIYKFPYLFASLEEVYASEDGESGRYMLDSLSGKNIYGLAFLDVGFREFTAKKPLNDVREIENLKLRIVDSVAFTTFAKALKANPVSTSMGELYTALSQGAADTQENPLSTICSQAFYEVTPYVTMTNHVWTYYVLGSNLDWWNSLPEAARALIEEVGTECSLYHRELAEELQEGYKKQIIDNGGTIVELTEDELAAWVEVGRSTHQELESLVGAEVVDMFYKDLGIEKTW